MSHVSSLESKSVPNEAMIEVVAVVIVGTMVVELILVGETL
jgi:hypothetical protein